MGRHGHPGWGFQTTRKKPAKATPSGAAGHPPAPWPETDQAGSPILAPSARIPHSPAPLHERKLAPHARRRYGPTRERHAARRPSPPHVMAGATPDSPCWRRSTQALRRGPPSGRRRRRCGRRQRQRRARRPWQPRWMPRTSAAGTRCRREGGGWARDGGAMTTATSPQGGWHDHSNAGGEGGLARGGVERPGGQRDPPTTPAVSNAGADARDELPQTLPAQTPPPPLSPPHVNAPHAHTAPASLGTRHTQSAPATPSTDTRPPSPSNPPGPTPPRPPPPPPRLLARPAPPPPPPQTTTGGYIKQARISSRSNVKAVSGRTGTFGRRGGVGRPPLPAPPAAGQLPPRPAPGGGHSSALRPSSAARDAVSAR